MVLKLKIVGRMLALYFCVLIPLISFSLLVTKNYCQRAEEQEEQSMKRILKDVAGELNGWHDDFQSQVAAIGEKQELSLYLIKGSWVKEMEAVETLKFVKLFSDRFDEIVIYYGVGKLYSSKGLTSIPIFFQNTLGCVPESLEGGVATLVATSSSVVYLQTETGQDVLMFHYPINKSSVASVQFIVSLDKIIDVIESYVIDGQMEFRLYVGQETILFGVEDGKCSVLQEETMQGLQKKYYHTLRHEMKQDNMTLELCFDPQLSSTDLKSFQYMNIGLLALGIFLSVFLSIHLSEHRWRRFQTMTSTFKMKNYPDTLTNGIKDEFGYIQILLEQSLMENEQVKQRSRDIRQGLVRQIAMMVFHGMVTNAEAIRQMLNCCDLELSKKYFYVCGILMKDSNADTSIFQVLFEESLFYEILVNGKRVILVLEEADTFDYECVHRTECAEKLYEYMDKERMPVCRVVFSQVYSELTMVNYAYLEVINLLGNTLRIESRIICWDDKRSFAADRLSPAEFELLSDYIEALECRNLDRVETTIRSMLGTDDASQYYLRYCIRQALSVAVRNDETEQSSTLLTRIDLIDLLNGADFEEQIIRILKSFCTEEKRSGQVQSAVEYIRENYSRYDLSLEDVAGCVGVSKTQMSRLFKSQFGMGYLDFLTKLRLHKAQELLVNTDQSVKSILLDVGYIDKTSFIKKFKANFGMTPTEYRKLEGGRTTDESKDGIE